jgi:hypothetical protein
VVSEPRPVPVSFAIPGGPTIESVTPDGDGKKLVVIGTNFNNVQPNTLEVKLRPAKGEEVVVKPDSITSTKLILTIPGTPKPTDCWTVIVTVSGFPRSAEKAAPCKP